MHHVDYNEAASPDTATYPALTGHKTDTNGRRVENKLSANFVLHMAGKQVLNKHTQKHCTYCSLGNYVQKMYTIRPRFLSHCAIRVSDDFVSKLIEKPDATNWLKDLPRLPQPRDLVKIFLYKYTTVGNDENGPKGGILRCHFELHYLIYLTCKCRC